MWRLVLWLIATLVAMPGYGQGGQGSAPSARGLASAHAPFVPDAARSLARRVLESDEAGGFPFAVVDKQAAMIAVFRSNGTL